MKNNIFLCFVCLFFLSACKGPDKQTYQGYVQAENLYISSLYEGRLITKAVSRGQRVKKGDLLFQLDNNPEFLQIQEQGAVVLEAQKNLIDIQKPRRPLEIEAIVDQIAQTEASLELATLRVKRYRELYAKNAVELDRVDEALSTQRLYQATKAQYQANLALAKLGARDDQIKAQEIKIKELLYSLSIEKWKLEQKTLSAPEDGLVVDTYYQKGELVLAGRPIAALLMPSATRIEFFVPAHDLSGLHLNQLIHFRCDGCSQEAAATISYISSEAEYVPPLVYTRDNTDYLVFRVKAQIVNPTLFKPGQPVVVTAEVTHE